MNSKLFSFKSIALLGIALLYMTTAVAQNDPKSTKEEEKSPDLIINLTNVSPTQTNPEGKPIQAVEIEIAESGSTITKEVEISDVDGPFYTVSDMPVYSDGRRELFQQIAKETRFPAEALKEKVQGIVIVQIIVEKDGSFTNPKVIAPVHPKLDEEALRVVSKLNNFIPGKNNGEVVRTFFQIPVPFLIGQKR
jgi:TonB family protein